jgi:hypothetical protein
MTRYEDDLYAWSTDQAALLKAGHMALLDLPHVIEELGNVGMSEYSELSNHLGILLAHLLKHDSVQEHRPPDFRRPGLVVDRSSACRSPRSCAVINPSSPGDHVQ